MCPWTGCQQPVSTKGLCDKHYERLAHHGAFFDNRSEGVDELTMQRFRNTAGTGPTQERCARILAAYRNAWWGIPYVIEATADELATRKTDRDATQAALSDNHRYRLERNFVSGF